MSALSQSLREERRARLAAAMAERGLDALFVVGNPWRCDFLRYAAGVAPAEDLAIAVIERDGAPKLFVESPGEAARIQAEQTELRVSWSPSAIGQAEKAMREMDGRNIALAPQAALPYRLARSPAAASVPAATAMLDRLMLRKSPAELEAIRIAAALADDGYRVFMAAARVGRPEYQLVADVEAYFRDRGCSDNFQLLGSGGTEVRGMHPPGERRIAAGDLVGTEITPCVEGYYAQICRTLVVGPPSDAQQRAFEVYNKALAAGIAAVRPGATAGDVARAENDVFRRCGLGEYVTSEYTRVRGHGIGLYVDARPAILEDVATVLEPDMTLVVHPNTYHPEIGYFLHGETVRVTEAGCEVLCRTPRELFSVPDL